MQSSHWGINEKYMLNCGFVGFMVDGNTTYCSSEDWKKTFAYI